MKIQEKIQFIIEHFKVAMPDVRSELNYESPYELLVATMLAAQCTDKRVNMVTPALFQAYPDALAMSKVTIEEILAFVKSVSYPNSKSAHLSAMSQMLVSDFHGEVPDTMEALTRLPGVGRKTANVVLAFAFNKPAMPVDTHVFRVAHRLGLAKASDTTPDAVEKRLVKAFPLEHLSDAHHWLLLHGRYTCTARAPKCEECPLRTICPSKQ